ncbi:MAG: hypothetical protein AAFW89_14715 [Bacteroidota bacterium]
MRLFTFDILRLLRQLTDSLRMTALVGIYVEDTFIYKDGRLRRYEGFRYHPGIMVKIDESKHYESDSILTRLKNSILSVLLAILLVQAFFFARSIYGGFSTPRSVFLLFQNHVFLLLLIVPAVLGWFYGGHFLSYLKAKIIDMVS